MSMASLSSFLLFFLLFILRFLLRVHSYSKVVVIPEEGFTVTTVLDGHKLGINPHSVLQPPGSSDHLILLDYQKSVFYTFQFPISKESVGTRFSGDGSAGYADGDVGSAQFDKPESFAVDLRGNVYVADRINGVIRKISSNGVTTIAGGFPEKSSRKDGPAQNVTFSKNFELAFIPGQCALLVSDREYQLVRQINLKEEDCTLGSNSGLRSAMIWTLGLVLSCLLCLAIGIAVGRYIIPNGGSSPCHFTETWKHCLTSLGKLARMLYFGIKSAVVSNICSSFCTILMKLWRLSISHLLMSRINLLSSRPHLESVSLLDLDACNSGEVTKSSKYHDQLKDLISFDEDHLGSTSTTFNQGYGADVMMQANKDHKSSILHQGSSVCNLGGVKRR